MAHEVCEDITSWVDPIQKQVEECIEQECYWLCLCCNKLLCSLVWVVIVAGKYIVETVCQGVLHLADWIIDFFRALWQFGCEVLNAGVDPEDANKALGMHVIVDPSAEEGGLSRNPRHQIDLIGGNKAKMHASAFNNSLGPGDGWYGEPAYGWYNDSGIRYSYRIDNNNQVCVSIGNGPERLVQHTPDAESIGTVVKDAPGPSVGITFVDKRRGELVRDLKFDMIAASGNRIFVREVDTANFYFASMQHEFLNHGPQELRGADKLRGYSDTVPGVYATLDAEHATKLCDFFVNPADDKKKYGQHPSLKAFANISGLMQQAIAGLVYEGLLIVTVFPELWHRLDTRPPVNSGMPPWFVETFEHITYEGPFDIKKVYKSIKIHGVLDIGVGHTNRILHHEAKYGDEVDTMNKGAYPAIAGPIEDGGGFCDGMCNFYVLCKIKIAPQFSILPQFFAAHTKLTYAILWIDEQTYFCERWRLVGFKDQAWYNLRAWGIASVYSSFNVDSLQYWSPFETSWWWDDSHITDESRLGVSKHTLVVNGRGRIRALHPDNDHEEVPPADRNRPAFHPVLYSVNFTFATSDRTWRWRGYPCPAAAGTDWTESGGAICLPETVRIREDMTIYLKGNNEASVCGYWYQKYLPADNTVVPDSGHLNIIGMPDYSYMHGWSFAEQGVFEAADRYSNLGVHARVDSRSQYYLLDIDENDLPEDFESVPWRDADSRLFWWYGLWANSEPSPYNTGSFFRILDRRPEGFIAVWWDKRDDELPGLNRIGGDLKLTRQGPGSSFSIMTKRFDRRRKLSPPVVQFAKVSLEVKEGVLVAFSLRFYTRMRMHDSWDFQALTPDEPNDGKDLDLVAEDPTIRKYVAEHTPDYVSYDSGPWSRPNFKPDTTIFRVRITAEDPRGVVVPFVTLASVVTIFNETVASGFSRKSRYEYLHEWERPTSGESHPSETALLDYCTKENAARLGTSVWFEDITGHVATAERTTFV